MRKQLTISLVLSGILSWDDTISGVHLCIPTAPEKEQEGKRQMMWMWVKNLLLFNK